MSKEVQAMKKKLFDEIYCGSTVYRYRAQTERRAYTSNHLVDTKQQLMYADTITIEPREIVLTDLDRMDSLVFMKEQDAIDRLKELGYAGKLRRREDGQTDRC